jgi:hypothetical protein
MSPEQEDALLAAVGNVLECVARNKYLYTPWESLHVLIGENDVGEDPANGVLVARLIGTGHLRCLWMEYHDWGPEFCEHCGGTLRPIVLTDTGRQYLSDLRDLFGL